MLALWFCLFSFFLVMVAVPRAAATGSPRVGAMVSSLAMVDSSLAMDSSKAPIILLRAMDSRTSTTVAVEVAEGVVEVRRCFQFCLIPIFCNILLGPCPKRALTNLDFLFPGCLFISIHLFPGGVELFHILHSFFFSS